MDTEQGETQVEASLILMKVCACQVVTLSPGL
uniref:Uncharacterized protein n=1 Tax=Anguilla anguilla TaxID=7936 RepID=A0A0E9U4W5_ANGAN